MGMEEALEFWLTQLKNSGKEVNPVVVRAARAVLPEVVSCGHKDPTAAVELLAKVAWQVSSSVFKGRSIALDKNGIEIESLEHYVFRSYLKKANHPYLTVAERKEVLSLESAEDSSDRGECVQRTEDHAQFWEIFDLLEPRMQLIFRWRTAFGYDWRRAGEVIGM